MKNVGITALIIVGLVFAAGVFAGVRSIPDVKRYVKMRQM